MVVAVAAHHLLLPLVLLLALQPLGVVAVVVAGALLRLQPRPLDLLRLDPLRKKIAPLRASHKPSVAAVKCRAPTPSRTKPLCMALPNTASISSSNSWSPTAPT